MSGLRVLRGLPSLCGNHDYVCWTGETASQNVRANQIPGAAWPMLKLLLHVHHLAVWLMTRKYNLYLARKSIATVIRIIGVVRRLSLIRGVVTIMCILPTLVTSADSNLAARWTGFFPDWQVGISLAECRLFHSFPLSQMWGLPEVKWKWW